ncbi:MAG: XdhC family protein [Candidatus Marinimicrobia bacterium]|nr:XdhC family protein [Candidatus Neomarinimicrobiota bacterium]
MKKSEMFKRISELLDEGKSFAVGTLLEVKGSAPQKVGAKMIIFEDSSIEFTIGGGPFEAQVIQDSVKILKNGSGSKIESYELTEDSLGMYCQGVSKVLIETFKPEAQLVVFGAGHVGSAIIKLAEQTGIFNLTIADDRTEYANKDKFTDSVSVILTDRDYKNGLPDVGPNSFIVIVTRCHPTDKELVKRYAGSNAAYIGMIGSKAKKKILFKELEKEGTSKAFLDKVHSPIGIPLGGKEPTEIAVSILAELIKVKNEIFG